MGKSAKGKKGRAKTTEKKGQRGVEAAAVAE